MKNLHSHQYLSDSFKQSTHQTVFNSLPQGLKKFLVIKTMPLVQ